MNDHDENAHEELIASLDRARDRADRLSRQNAELLAALDEIVKASAGFPHISKLASAAIAKAKGK